MKTKLNPYLFLAEKVGAQDHPSHKPCLVVVVVMGFFFFGEFGDCALRGEKKAAD